jgi:hypothetical protein
MVEAFPLLPGLDKILMYIVGSSGKVHGEAPAASQLLMAASRSPSCVNHTAVSSDRSQLHILLCFFT